jgi:hypothetical protein
VDAATSQVAGPLPSIRAAVSLSGDINLGFEKVNHRGERG